MFNIKSHHTNGSFFLNILNKQQFEIQDDELSKFWKHGLID